MSGSYGYDKRKRFLQIAAALVSLAVLAVGAGAAGKYAAEKKNQASRYSQQADPPAENILVDGKKSIFVNGVEYVPKNNVETVLVIGVDAADEQLSTESYRNTDQADFLLLIVIDNEDSSYRSLALNRDTMTRIPALGADGVLTYWTDGQLALAHTYGTGRQDSCLNQVWAVSELLYDIPIDHYISLSMPAIGCANDAVGGVTVKIEDDFSESDPSLVMGETITLNAVQAEHFVRGRMNMGEPTNLNRMKRQKTYMAEWKKAAVERLNNDDSFFLKLIGMISDYMISDMSVNKLSELSDSLSTYTDNGVVDTKGTAEKNGKYMEYHVDDEDLRNIVLDLYYDAAE